MGDQCNEFLDQLQLYLDSECGPDMQARIERHMADCPPCGHRADFDRRLRDIVAGACRDKAPDGLVDSVLNRLQLG